MNGASPSDEKRVGVRAHIRGGSLVRPHERVIGIPDRSVSTEAEVAAPETWEFGIHDHEADVAGRHFDLRLGDRSSGIAYSWAIPKARLPAPGEKLLAVKQPDHTVEYMDFHGVIREGYGAGNVKLHVRTKTEVVTANSDYLKFNLYTGTAGSSVTEFLLRRLDEAGNWLLMNTTQQPKPWIPEGKPPYKSVPMSSLRTDIEDEVFQAKIDGAHVLVVLEPGKQVGVYSHRRSRRGGGLIEHTHKIHGLVGKKTPEGTPRTVVRAELWAKDSKGVALDSSRLSGLLNSSVWKARNEAKKLGVEFNLALFDVHSVGSKDMVSERWDDKQAVLSGLADAFPQMSLPATAVTERGKEALLKLMKAGKLEQSKEGVVMHSLHGGPVKKAKFTDDYDVYVREIFPAIGADGRELGRAGGFSWSRTPDGPILGKVGTGFDHQVLRDMRKDPEKYLGRSARLKAQEEHRSGALRAPSFLGWHLDK